MRTWCAGMARCGWVSAAAYFQATFVVLARKAPSIRQPDSLANWLYRVACHVSLRVRRQSQQQPLPGEVEKIVDRQSLDEVSRRHQQQIIEEEFQRLPEQYRSPLVLCCVCNQSREGGASNLGIGPIVLKARLQRSPRLLRYRLTLRGISAATAFAVLSLTRDSAANAVTGVRTVCESHRLP